MSRKPSHLAVAADPRAERGDATRQKLLEASIDVFGRLGFDGATTRAVADAAGVNLQAIPYYFGSKDGLFIATAEHIATRIKSQFAELYGRVQARLAEAEAQGIAIDAKEARELLTEIIQLKATLYVSDESESWARFLQREQLDPTEAFARVYRGVMKPSFDVIARLVAILLDEDPLSEHVRLRAMSLLGAVMVFRTAKAAASTHLGWTKTGPRELDAIHALAAELVASIGQQGKPG
jgi:TetR/AcrR family transcriptional regulator, regulator of cefoperazone and chloramphenicol sensitivity